MSCVVCQGSGRLLHDVCPLCEGLSVLLETDPDSSSSWTSDRVRSSFCQFFESKGHQHVPPSKVIPSDDPSLFFTNSGMCQFKKVFLNMQSPEELLRGLGVKDVHSYRLCNSQPCVRLSGKHNDFDVVGRDNYHHTLFEMLGTWSLQGDYGKEQIIEWSLELLIDVWGLDPKRMYFTYFRGNEELDPDLETCKLWLQHGGRRGVPQSHIIGFVEDNFWSMGPTGPCGPCTEIHYDRQSGRSVPDLVNRDDPEVIELWNLVFMDWNRVCMGQLEPLSDRHIDTGMGLERVVSVLQGQSSNYDTDIFGPYFQHIERHWGVRKYTGRTGEEDLDLVDMSYRVVSDHIRTLVFGIVDGGSFGHNGCDHELKKIHRRSLFHCKKHLNGGSLLELVPLVVENLHRVYPRLHDQGLLDLVQGQLSRDKEQFDQTIRNGKKEIRKLVKRHVGSQQLPVLCRQDLDYLKSSHGLNLETIQLILDIGLHDELLEELGVNVQIDRTVN